MEQKELFKLSQEIADKADYDGFVICDVFLEALTDANYHNLRKQLEVVINKAKQ